MASNTVEDRRRYLSQQLREKNDQVTRMEIGKWGAFIGFSVLLISVIYLLHPYISQTAFYASATFGTIAVIWLYWFMDNDLNEAREEEDSISTAIISIDMEEDWPTVEPKKLPHTEAELKAYQASRAGEVEEAIKLLSGETETEPKFCANCGHPQQDDVDADPGPESLTVFGDDEPVAMIDPEGIIPGHEVGY